MTLRTGQSLLQYRVVERIGAGGMGEVYRAEDTRLGRHVAIKLLPEKLRRDPERLARLEREARTLATLNHAHVATLHGLEEDEDGTRFLVMELVEGETLAARLERGALPLGDVCALGAQIAEALAAAHERGIVHRDLKPGNVMLTRDGVKLLDFGLAKAAEPAAGEPQTEARTLAAEPEKITGEGTLLGTFQYMAPEQLEGHEADARSDVWALGAVLHEMATGRPAFEGGSTASLIAAILEREPARVSEARELAPPALDHLVATCLIKDPDRRRRSASDLALDLRWLAAEGVGGRRNAESRAEDAAVATDRRGTWLAWTAGATLVVGVAALVWAWSLVSGADPGARAGRRAVFELAVPALDWNATETGLAVSPEGDTVAYMSEPAPGRPPVLWLRDVDGAEPRQVPETERAANPFWSPDGRRVGYVRDGAIRVVDREGGPTRTVAPVQGTTFGPPSWSPDGTILFASGPVGGARLTRVRADGGDPVDLTVPAGGIGHVFPSALPGGNGFLYLELQETAERANVLYMAPLDGGDPVRIDGVHSRARYAAGHLFYWDQGALVARRFDLDSATFTADPSTVGEMPGAYYARTGMAEFAVARNGATVAHGRTVRSDELRWFDSSGRDLGRLGEPGLYRHFRISPAGDRVAMGVEDPRTGNQDISIFDVRRGVPARTFGGAGDDSNPVWSPDGERITYSSDAQGPPRIYVRRADGSGEARLVPANIDEPLYVRDWSANGRYLSVNGEMEDWRVYIVPVDGEGSARLFADGAGDQGDARFSPDSRWVAFSSEEPGQTEVFVAPLVGTDVPQRVSNGGGRHPAWSPDGSELYYVNGSSLYAVSFSPEAGAVGMTRELFSLGPTRSIVEMDVAPDGERFLVAVGDRGESGAAIRILLNWLAERQ